MNSPQKSRDFPKLAAPAQRALASLGVTDLEKLSQFTEVEIARLHGMGPSALAKLCVALRELGLSFKQAKEEGSRK